MSGVNCTREWFSDSACDSARTSKRLAEPGHAFDQRVTRGDQRDDDLFDDFVLSDDGLADRLPQLVE